MSDTPQEILIKIQALFAKSKSAEEIGSLAEAETFAKKAQALLVKYNLSIDELNAANNKEGVVDEEVIEVMDRAKKSEGTWMSNLYAVIAKHNFCKIILFGSGKWSILLIGEEHNRMVVKDLVESLIGRVKDIEKKDWKEYDTTESYLDAVPIKRGAFRRSFYRGAVVGINNQLQNQMDQLKQEMPEVNSMALVKTDCIAVYVDQKHPNLRRSRGTRVSGHGAYEKGRAAGEGMGVNRGVGGQSGNKLLN